MAALVQKIVFFNQCYSHFSPPSEYVTVEKFALKSEWRKGPKSDFRSGKDFVEWSKPFCPTQPHKLCRTCVLALEVQAGISITSFPIIIVYA